MSPLEAIATRVKGSVDDMLTLAEIGFTSPIRGNHTYSDRELLRSDISCHVSKYLRSYLPESRESTWSESPAIQLNRPAFVKLMDRLRNIDFSAAETMTCCWSRYLPNPNRLAVEDLPRALNNDLRTTAFSHVISSTSSFLVLRLSSYDAYSFIYALEASADTVQKIIRPYHIKNRK